MRRDYPAVILAFMGVVVIGIGVYFMVFRPALLPEDLRYMQTSPEQFGAVAPQVAEWLRYVFRVAGGYMAATGLLTVYVAATSFRTGARGATAVVALAGLVSIGLMSAVNVLIGSDFRWYVAAVAVLWLLAVAMRALDTGAVAEIPGGRSELRP